jgi:triacylglycerol lipase
VVITAIMVEKRCGFTATASTAVARDCRAMRTGSRMIATKHHGRTCRLAAAFAAGATIASGYGSPAAWADSSEPASSGAWTLLDASNDFAPTIGAASPAADASSGALINELMTATQGVSSDASIPASSTGDGLFSSLLAFIDGVSPPPSAPGDLVTFSGSSSLFNTLLVSAFDSLEPLEKDLGTNFSAELAPLISSASPPAWLESSAGLTVTETQYDGMPVYDLTPADPSGDYVVATTAARSLTSLRL